MAEVSQISVSSKITQNKVQSPCTSKFEQSTEGGAVSTRTFQTNSHDQKINMLSHQISVIEKAQIEMERKFQKCIESLVKEIQNRENVNNSLLQQASQLKQNIEDSKKDIHTIANFVRKYSKNKNPHTNSQNNQSNTRKNLVGNNERLLKRSLETKNQVNSFSKGLRLK